MWKRALVLVALSVPAAAKPPSSKLTVTHPILEVLDPLGAVSAVEVREGLGRIAPYLAACGDNAQWTGEALIWLVTDWHGKVMKVEVAANKAPVERCLVAALKRIVVPKAQGRATTMMRLRLAE